MKRRTNMFAINIARLTQKLPDTPENRAYRNQIIGLRVPLKLITELREELNQNQIL